MEIEFQVIPDSIRFAEVLLAEATFTALPEVTPGTATETTFSATPEPNPGSLVLPIAMGVGVVIAIAIICYQHQQNQKDYENKY